MNITILLSLYLIKSKTLLSQDPADVEGGQTFNALEQTHVCKPFTRSVIAFTTNQLFYKFVIHKAKVETKGDLRIDLFYVSDHSNY